MSYWLIYNINVESLTNILVSRPYVKIRSDAQYLETGIIGIRGNQSF